MPADPKDQARRELLAAAVRRGDPQVMDALRGVDVEQLARSMSAAAREREIADLRRRVAEWRENLEDAVREGDVVDAYYALDALQSVGRDAHDLGVEVDLAWAEPLQVARRAFEAALSAEAERAGYPPWR